MRRTPRPTGDRQTPETVAQLPRGATNAPTSVSEDAGNGTGDLSPEVAAALVEQHGPELRALAELAQQGMAAVASQVLAIYRSPASDALAIEREDGEFTCVERHPDGGWRGTGLIEVVPDDWVLARYQPGPECDMEAYAALPPCTACEGGGQDTHGTVFEAPLAVHFAGPPVEIAGRRRQLCMWCGHVLIDVALTRDAEPPEWPIGVLIKVEDGLSTVVPHEPGDALPPGCCALPDDEGVDPVDGYPVDLCGKHAGTCSNRCLLRAGHDGECDDDPPKPGPGCYPPVDGWDGIAISGCCTACNGTGTVETGYPCEDCYATGHSHPETVSCDGAQAADGPDEAQETRAAADWPAEEADRG